MKILVLADEESKYLWDYYEKSKLDGIDLIISCGDLKPEYLTFLATLATVPLLYVHGNHDAIYDEKPPEGCICIDDTVYEYKGIRIAGLGGSMCYNMKKYQYTEKEMKSRVRKLRFKIIKHKGIDILVTHSPSAGFNDGEDIPHKGFEVFNTILEKYKPKYHLHGHVHLNYNWAQKRESIYNDYTIVINGYEKYIFEY